MKRAGSRLVALWCAVSAIAGCAATDKLTQGSDVTSTFANLLAFNTTKPGPAPAGALPRDPELKCPEVQVLDGTAAYRTYAGTDQSNGDVRYQFSMGDVARECTRAGNQILLKIGVEGRVLLGPAGSAGTFTVPLRIAVRRDADGKAAAAKLYQVPANIVAGSDSTDFQLVSDPLAVPYLRANADDDYTVLVGFDAGAPKAADTAPQGRRKGRGRPDATKPSAPAASPQG